MNLKQILMELGNRLVQKQGYDPSGPLPREAREQIAKDNSTEIITLFTEWINIHDQAQWILEEMGVKWPMPQERGRTMGRKDSAYVLVDAEVRAEESPDFIIPPEEDRQNLRPGDFAKVIFDQPELTEQSGLVGERMWVEVTEISPEGYVGGLASHPVVIPILQFDDMITFGPENVIQIERRDSRRR